MPVSLCWNAIVKNESGRIVRAAQSLLGVIDSAVITDTGSTDDTKEKLQKFLVDSGVPCIIVDAPFIDWSQARQCRPAGR